MAVTRRAMFRTSRPVARVGPFRSRTRRECFSTVRDCTMTVTHSCSATRFSAAAALRMANACSTFWQRTRRERKSSPRNWCAASSATIQRRRLSIALPLPFSKTDGSIRETLRAIITAPEFFAADAYRSKMRSPCAYVAAAFRATSAETDGDRPVRDFLGRTGQLLYGGVTPDGYAHREDVWLSRGAMVGRLNFAAALATKRLRCTSVNFSKVL